MKKIIFILSIFFASTLYVNAEEYISVEVVENVYSNYNIDGEDKYDKLAYIRDSNGNYLYCVKKGTKIKTLTYESSNDFMLSNIPYELKDTLELINYYGYGYQDNYSVEQYMATQELIWHVLGVDVTWTTGANGTGEIIDVSQFKDVIMNNVNNYFLTPQFNEPYVEGRVGTEKVVYDEKGVLINYFLYNDSGNIVEKEHNSIRFKFYVLGEKSIILRKNLKDLGETKVYYAENSQTLMYFGKPVEEDYILNYNVYGGNIFIQKIDQDLGTNTARGEASLQSGSYSIYDSDGNLIQTVITDENGVYSANGFALGTYTIREDYPSMGYLPSPYQYLVELSFGDSVKTLTIPCKVLEKKLEIYNYYQDEVLRPAINEFNIYDLHHRYLYTVTTDINGYTNIDLPYGSYIIKQMTVDEGYEISGEFNFYVDFVESQTMFEIINIKKIIIEEEQDVFEEQDIPDEQNISNEDIQENIVEENNEESNQEIIEEEILPDLYVGKNIFIYIVGCYICLRRLLHQ